MYNLFNDPQNDLFVAEAENLPRYTIACASPSMAARIYAEEFFEINFLETSGAEVNITDYFGDYKYRVFLKNGKLESERL